jgi:hypothetical protein
MPRLVTFGCSFTYGQGLPDCHIPPNLPGPKPSKFAWPQLLADKLNYECLNYGEFGFSNLAILDRILNFDFKHGDIICVLWTFKNRMLEYGVNKNTNYGRWDQSWLKAQNKYDLILKNHIFMNHGYLYLKDAGLHSYHMDVDYYFNEIYNDLLPKWTKNIELMDIDFSKIEKIPPLGLDNLHPGIQFHKIVADKLFDKITNVIY